MGQNDEVQIAQSRIKHGRKPPFSGYGKMDVGMGHLKIWWQLFAKMMAFFHKNKSCELRRAMGYKSQISDITGYIPGNLHLALYKVEIEGEELPTIQITKRKLASEE